MSRRIVHLNNFQFLSQIFIFSKRILIPVSCTIKLRHQKLTLVLLGYIATQMAKLAKRVHLSRPSCFNCITKSSRSPSPCAYSPLIPISLSVLQLTDIPLHKSHQFTSEHSQTQGFPSNLIFEETQVLP